MAEYRATVHWSHTQGDFRKGTYSREHTWTFDGGQTIPASSSPHVVRVPYSNPAYVDPEEAFVASIASCHLLTFLYIAQRRGYEIDRYEDTAVGRMTENERGQPWVSSVELAPQITWRGDRRPAPEELAQLHEQAHAECYIANSVKTEIRVKPE